MEFQLYAVAFQLLLVVAANVLVRLSPSPVQNGILLSVCAVALPEDGVTTDKIFVYSC